MKRSRVTPRVVYPISGPELASVLRPPAVRAYLRGKGWAEKPVAGPYALFEGPLAEDGAPFIQVVPLPEADDYLPRLEDLLMLLSHFEDRDARAVLADILAQPVDAPAPPAYAEATSPTPTAPP